MKQVKSGSESESEVTQSCLTLCEPMDCSLAGSSIHGILRSGLPFPSPGNLPDSGIKPLSPTLQADSKRPPLKVGLSKRCMAIFKMVKWKLETRVSINYHI